MQRYEGYFQWCIIKKLLWCMFYYAENPYKRNGSAVVQSILVYYYCAINALWQCRWVYLQNTLSLLASVGEKKEKLELFLLFVTDPLWIALPLMRWGWRHIPQKQLLSFCHTIVSSSQNTSTPNSTLAFKIFLKSGETQLAKIVSTFFINASTQKSQMFH